MRSAHWLMASIVGALLACAKQPEPAKSVTADSQGKASGMAMSMPSITMMPMMRAHCDSLAGMAPEQLAKELGTHADLAAWMMDAMGADMRSMKMQPDAAWTALTDSVRRDLAELPGLSGNPLKSRMQAHIGRMRRMMDMHVQMTKM